ncbi:MAG: SWIM zinc finger family protein [Saprospiraceae bacterium]|nr:SWIM zinc finger family protein [Saprospiraceae bacterium]
MNYHDFEDHVHAIILERGKDYFDRGAVRDLEQTAEGWTVVIEGQTRYTVVLHGRRQLEDWFCECPHAHGPVCKHVAAALYAVRKWKRQTIEQELNKMSDVEMRDFICVEAVASPDLFDAILNHAPSAITDEEEE